MFTNFSLFSLLPRSYVFKTIYLPHFMRILDSFANCPSDTSIRVGVFAAEICDFVTFFISIKASSNGFTRFWKLMIL